MVEIVGHSQTKGRDNREPKLRPKPARQSSTLPMSEVWKRRSWLGCSGTARRKGRQTDMFDLKPPRHISTLPFATGPRRRRIKAISGIPRLIPVLAMQPKLVLCQQRSSKPKRRRVL